MNLTNIISILLLVAIVTFFVAPDKFYLGRDWVVDKISSGGSNESKIESNCIDTKIGCEYGNIITEAKCKSDSECVLHFNIDNLKCINGLCYGVDQ